MRWDHCGGRPYAQVFGLGPTLTSSSSTLPAIFGGPTTFRSITSILDMRTVGVEDGLETGKSSPEHASTLACLCSRLHIVELPPCTYWVSGLFVCEPVLSLAIGFLLRLYQLFDDEHR